MQENSGFREGNADDIKEMVLKSVTYRDGGGSGDLGRAYVIGYVGKVPVTHRTDAGASMTILSHTVYEQLSDE